MSNQPAYPNPSGYDYMQPPAAPPRNYNAPPANYPQQYQPIQNIHADNQIMVGQPDAGGPGYMQIGPPVHWCAYVWIIIVLALFVLLDAITYFAIPTWYNYCYFYIGPHTVWPAFSHWSEDTTIDTLKNDICRTGAGGSETNLIATCISAYCPKICHYFKNDITDAANAQMPFSVLYIVLGCLTIVLIFVQATCLRNRPNTRPVFIIFCISCFLMWMFQLIAFVRYNSVGDFDGFKSVQDSIIPGCYFSYDDSDVSADDADKPNNSSKAGGYYWALVLLIINSITLLALFPRMLWNLRLSRQVNQKVKYLELSKMGCSWGRDVSSKVYLRKYWQADSVAKSDYERYKHQEKAFLSNNSTHELMIVNGNLAETCIYLSNFKNAAMYCKIAIEMAKELGYKDELSEWQVNSALIDIRQQNYSAALPKLQLADRILTSNQTILKCYIDALTWICLPEEKAQYAKSKVQSCVDLAKSIGNQNLHLECLLAQGLTNKNTDLKDSKLFFENALYVACSYKNNLFQSIIFNELGDVWVYLDTPATAIGHFKNAWSSAKLANSTSNRARALWGLIRCYDEENQYGDVINTNYFNHEGIPGKEGALVYADLIPDLETIVSNFENDLESNFESSNSE